LSKAVFATLTEISAQRASYEIVTGIIAKSREQWQLIEHYHVLINTAANLDWSVRGARPRMSADFEDVCRFEHRRLRNCETSGDSGVKMKSGFVWRADCELRPSVIARRQQTTQIFPTHSVDRFSASTKSAVPIEGCHWQRHSFGFRRQNCQAYSCCTSIYYWLSCNKWRAQNMMYGILVKVIFAHKTRRSRQGSQASTDQTAGE
jgi:hypothetical protein